MDTDYFIGIDPGITGGIVAVDRSGAIASMARFDGSNPLVVIKEALGGLGVGRISVALEKVGARPGQCVSSMFKFGEGYGAIQGLLWGLDIEVTLYSPQEWQKYLPPAPTPKGRVLAYLGHKGIGELFIYEGCRVPHQGCADSFGIADYHRLVSTGSLARPKSATKPPKKRLKPMRF